MNRLSPLGQLSSYVDQYDATLLCSIARHGKRVEIGVDGVAPFLGADIWTAYEVSWLNARGKPQLAIMHLTIPCETPNIIESKSLKLYLNSFNNTVFTDSASVAAILRQDISTAAWKGVRDSTNVQGAVGVKLIEPAAFSAELIRELSGLSLDRLDIDCARYTPAPELLCTVKGEAAVTEVLVSDLLKSNCLVTGQPDWGSIQISYCGRAIKQEGLLQYLVSYRSHNEFHEQCVERIFMDIWRYCQPIRLAVYARYTRRGGLDINPYRTSHPELLPQNIRTARQ